MYNIFGQMYKEVKRMSVDSSKNTKRIVEAAIGLFREKGFRQTGVAEICEKAGLPRSSFYALFSSKEDVLGYFLKSVHQDFEKKLPEFLKAETDLERIYYLVDAFLQNTEYLGPEIARAAYIMELEGVYPYFAIFESFGDIAVTLIRNCQKNGLVGNTADAEELQQVLVDLTEAVSFDWIRTGGAFPLREQTRKELDVLLNVNRS